MGSPFWPPSLDPPDGTSDEGKRKGTRRSAGGWRDVAEMGPPANKAPPPNKGAGGGTAQERPVAAMAFDVSTVPLWALPIAALLSLSNKVMRDPSFAATCPASATLAFPLASSVAMRSR